MFAGKVIFWSISEHRWYIVTVLDARPSILQHCVLCIYGPHRLPPYQDSTVGPGRGFRSGSIAAGAARHWTDQQPRIDNVFISAQAHQYTDITRAVDQRCTNRMASAMAELAIKVFQQTTASPGPHPCIVRHPPHAVSAKPKTKSNSKGISPRSSPQRMTTLHRKERRSRMRRPVKLHTIQSSHQAAYKASMPRKASAPAMPAPMAAEGTDAAPGASVG